MREIKFRAWDIEKKVFIPTDVYAIIGTTTFGAFGIMIKDWENYKEGEYFYKHSQILMQYAGLKDKNGKEIYEGDIVVWRRDDIANGGEEIISSGGRGVISWSKEFAMFSFSKPDAIGCFQMEDNEYEVIGNIYENPELLQSEEK